MSNLTISGWVRPESLGSGFQRWIGTWDGSNGWIMQMQSSKMYTYIDTAGGILEAISTTTLTAGTLYHVVGRYNGSNIQNFINALPDGNPRTQTGAVTTGSLSNFGIGEFPNFVGQSTDGLLDEMRIFNGAKSNARIRTEYNNQSSTSTFFFIGPQETDEPPSATSTPFGIITGGGGISGGGIIR
jgi:hypothetical protein